MLKSYIRAPVKTEAQGTGDYLTLISQDHKRKEEQKKQKDKDKLFSKIKEMKEAEEQEKAKIL